MTVQLKPHRVGREIVESARARRHEREIESPGARDQIPDVGACERLRDAVEGHAIRLAIGEDARVELAQRGSQALEVLGTPRWGRSEEHTSELQSLRHL